MKSFRHKIRHIFSPAKMPTPHLRCAYKVVDDCVIYADVYLPPTASPPTDKTQCPVVLAIHGGAFILGHSDMVNKDQIQDCLDRGWITLSLEHRLCPQVDILEGPITDCRDALAWVYNGGLDAELARNPSTAAFAVDKDRVVAFGTSSGGAIALALGYSVPRPPLAILDFYGATHFTHPFWSTPLRTAKLPPNTDPDYINQVYDESPVPIRGGVSLEGQAPAPAASALTTTTTTPTTPATPSSSSSIASTGSTTTTSSSTNSTSPPPPSSSTTNGTTNGTTTPSSTKKEPQTPTQTQTLPPRPSFALTHIARGTLLRVCYPFGPLSAIDAAANITPAFPPTCVVHGTADESVPIELSRELYGRLLEAGVRGCEWIEVRGEGHTFAGGMEKGSETWGRQRGGFDWLEGRMGGGGVVGGGGGGGSGAVGVGGRGRR
ncbi:myb dna-binding domain protein [Diplodia corticola]|uniref:Myb dna-binding domain protein n=1 Tax=Diplodia corticola TaxID=236234 RepID=A0A1J9SCG8_9PEZI|nr:myb dna-binding domain protein [Diplodia corticola]OJD37540.1 myb dna-binding domain protein [Diplodia corticola]